MRSSSRRRRNNEEAPGNFINGKPDEKSRRKPGVDEGRKSSPAKCEAKGEEVESNGRRLVVREKLEPLFTYVDEDFRRVIPGDQ